MSRVSTKKVVREKIGSKLIFAIFAVAQMLIGVTDSWARDIKYLGGELSVYVNPGEPTQLLFPGKIQSGFKPKNTRLALDRKENYLVIFSQADLTEEGEALLVMLDDKRSYAVRIMPANDDNPRDEIVKVLDEREESDGESSPPTQDFVPRTGFAPANVPTGLMREMILAAEMGKQKTVPGYKRSNKYSGEVVLHDGSVEAKIDEIFMGPEMWGYVLTVENLLDTTQKLNPASFRLDGTRAVSAERWELAARPQTAEQKLAANHKAKVYIITRSLSN